MEKSGLKVVGDFSVDLCTSYINIKDITKNPSLIIRIIKNVFKVFFRIYHTPYKLV